MEMKWEATEKKETVKILNEKLTATNDTISSVLVRYIVQ